MVRSALVLGLAFVIALPAAGQPPKEKASIFFETGTHTGHINAALFTKDSKQLITIADDKTIRFWDVERGEQVKVLYPPIGPGPEGGLLAAALSPDGKTLAVGGYGYGDDGNRQSPIFLIDLATDRVRRVLKGHANATIYALAFSPDGKRLASGAGYSSRDPKRGPIREWNLETNEPELTLGLKGGATGPAATKMQSP